LPDKDYLLSQLDAQIGPKLVDGRGGMHHTECPGTN